jgi:hypothetical protein
MEVTSIRLERDLKDKLKELSGNQGIKLSSEISCGIMSSKNLVIINRNFHLSDIRASIAAIAQKEERCVLTGQLIRPQESMCLGLTSNGDLVPLCMDLGRSK